MQFLQDPAQHDSDPDGFLLRQGTAFFKDLFERISGNILLDHRQCSPIFAERADPGGVPHRAFVQRGINSKAVDGKGLFYIALSGFPVTDDRDTMLFIQLRDLLITGEGIFLVRHRPRSFPKVL